MKRYVKKGDLLKTNPLYDFWVCSLVLDTRDKTNDFDPMCHVGVTNIVSDHNFDVSEIDIKKLEIIHTETLGGKTVPCIGIYASKITKEIEMIGNIDSEAYYNCPLKFKIGNGSNGGWPQCGSLKKSLGFEAVHQWRAANDRVAWLKDVKEAEKSHKEMLENLKNKN